MQFFLKNMQFFLKKYALENALNFRIHIKKCNNHCNILKKNLLRYNNLEEFSLNRTLLQLVFRKINLGKK